MDIQELNISYPDFVLNTTIDPEQFDTNNREIVNKINELLATLHSISGASEIVANTITGVSTSTDLQTMLQAIKTYLDASDATISTDLFNKYNEVKGLIATNTSDIASLQLNKADKATTYLKTEVYSKTEADTILTTHKTSADHDGMYYTESEINTMNTNHKLSTSTDHDNRYYTEAEIDTKIGTLNTTDTTNANNLTIHKTSVDHDTRYYTKALSDSTFTTKTESALKADKTTTYTKSEVDTKIANLGIGNPDILATYKDQVTTSSDVNNLVVPTNKSLNINKIEGRTIINLLGTDGNCENTNIFTITGGSADSTITIDTVNKVNGTGSLKIQLGNTVASMSKTKDYGNIIQVGKYYCASGYVKSSDGIASGRVYIRNAVGTTAYYSNLITDTTFTKAFFKFIGTSDVVRLGYSIYSGDVGVNAGYVNIDSLMLEEISEIQYNDVNFQPSEYVDRDYSVGESVTIINTKDTNSNIKSYFKIPTVLRNITSAIKDSIEDNKIIKRVEKITLDGSYGWLFGANLTGYKRVYLPNDTILNSTSLGDGILIKYNGKLCNNTKSSVDGIDNFYLSSNSVRIYISNIDSGWGDSYAPTSAEIKAYFYGYKMNNGTFGTAYNGTGTKTWTTMSATSNVGSVTVCPTTMAIDGYAPYRLYYQLSTPITTDIIKPNLVAYPSGTINITSTNDIFVRPTITYQIADSEKANIDELLNNLSSNISNITEVMESVHENTNLIMSDLAEKADKDGTVQVNLNAQKLNSKTASATPLTTEKTDLIGMVNELFTNANNGKQNWVDVVGSPLVNTDTFSTLKSKTQTIKDGLATNLVAKGVSATGTETLTALKDKVANINTKMYSQVSRTGYEALILNCIIDGYGYFVDTSSKVAIKINLKNNTVEKAIDCSTLTGNICSYTDYGILIGTGTWYRVYNEAKTLLSENLSRGAYTTQDTSFHSSLFITGNKLYSVASNGTDNSIEYYSNGTYIGKLYRAINGSTNFGNICGLLYVKNNSVEKMIITTQYTNTINYYKLINDISITSTKTDGSDLTKISSNAIYNSLSYCLMNDLI